MPCLLFTTNQSGRQCWTLSLFLWGLSTSGPESRSSAWKNDSVCSLVRVSSKRARTRKGQVWLWLRNKTFSSDGDTCLSSWFVVQNSPPYSLSTCQLLIALWLGLEPFGFITELFTSKGFIRASSWSCRSRKQSRLFIPNPFKLKVLEHLWSDHDYADLTY